MPAASLRLKLLPYGIVSTRSHLQWASLGIVFAITRSEFHRIQQVVWSSHCCEVSLESSSSILRCVQEGSLHLSPHHYMQLMVSHKTRLYLLLLEQSTV